MDRNGQKYLKSNLSPLGALAFSIGTALGWGSLVVTGTSYLAQSGIAGSIAGMVVGMTVMFIVARNYAYMMQMHPDAGGAYAFSRNEFGNDYGFLTAWFLALTYLAVLWANATSIPLFTKYFIGPVLQTGKLYTLFGYDIFAGEVVATIAVILITALLCVLSKSAVAAVMTVLTALFVIAIIFTSISAMSGLHGEGMMVWTSPFVPESNEIMQIIRIAVISPWAFIGFESISHRAEEFNFDHKKLYNILVAAVAITALIYILLIMLSVTAYPERYGSWLEYIRDRENLDGLEALPAFYAADHYLGAAGVRLMMGSLMALVITSLIGNTTALSRLFYALGKDGVLPARFAKIDRHGTPGHAIMLVALISCVIPFVGRTAIGWIVDVTNIGAILIYGAVSAAAMKRASIRGDKVERTTGLAGIIIMVIYALVTLVPALIFEGYIETETFLLFIVWSILGFVYFRWLLGKDEEKKYGKSTVVWMALMALVLTITLVWMRQSMITANNEMTERINSYYEQMDDSSKDEDEEFIIEQIEEMNANDRNTIVASIGMLAFALLVLLNNNTFMNRRAQESERMVNIDSLTGVKSKHAYLAKCKEMDAEITEGNSGKFAVAVCDLNGLKYINDTQGHKAGDEYICAASRMICKIFQHSPVFRIGGDEFVVIMRGHDYNVRRDLMQTLHDYSETSISNNGVVIAGGCSDFAASTDSNIHAVFERADKQMYEEKMLLKEMGAVTRED